MAALILTAERKRGQFTMNIRRKQRPQRDLVSGLLILCALNLGVLICLNVPVSAATDEPFKIGEVEVKPAQGQYLVTTDLNVRAIPATKGKRLTTLRKGEEVSAVGQAQGSWLAIELEDGKFGFVYQPALMPLQDGRLDKDLSGVIRRNDGRQCEYVIRFDGKTEIQGLAFQSSDYQAGLSCALKSEDKPLVFSAPMFMTEGPFNGTRRPVFQVGVDLLELSKDYDRFFSTNLIYDRGKSEVRFDNASVKTYAKAPSPNKLPANSLDAAIVAALTLAIQAWTPAVWKDLATELHARKNVEVTTQ